MGFYQAVPSRYLFCYRINERITTAMCKREQLINGYVRCQKFTSCELGVESRRGTIFCFANEDDKVSLRQCSIFRSLCHSAKRSDMTLRRTEIRCLAVGKAPMNSTVPCISTLAVGSRIDGPDDINSPALQCPATVHAVQWFVYSAAYSAPATAERGRQWNDSLTGTKHLPLSLSL
jgi:hypothetical protein